MTTPFQRALLLFFVFGIAILIFGIWKTIPPGPPQPGSCKILEEKYCKLGKVTKLTIDGKTYTFIGFNFPEGVRVPIFAAADGRLLLSKENSREFKGTSAAIKATSGEVYDFKGNIDVSQFGTRLDIPIKAGEIIGYVQSTDAKSLGSYDAVFTISKAGVEQTEIVDKLRKLKLINE